MALIDPNIEINGMTMAYTTKFDFIIWKISVGTLKINSSLLKTYNMILTSFLLHDSLERIWFFEETFLLADTSMEVVLKILFLSLSNTDVEFAELEKLTWRLYIIAEALPITSQVKLIDKKKFAKVTLDENSETFIIHKAALETITISLSWIAQIAAV